MASSCRTPATTVASTKKPGSVAVAARQHLGVRGQPGQELLDPLLVGRAVDRTVVAAVVRPADPESLRRLRQQSGELVVHGRLDQHAGGRGAVLAGVEVAGGGDRLGRGREVGVLEHQRRRLATQLQVHVLERLGRRRHDLRAGPGAAGDRDHVGARVLHEGSPGVAVAAQDVEHARGEHLLGELGQPHGAPRRRVGGLEHHRVAGGDGGTDLPDRHHQRVVPGRHLGDDADGLAADGGGEAGFVLRRRHAVQHPGRAGEEPELVHARVQLQLAGLRPRLAGVADLALDELVGVLLDEVGQSEQGLLSLRGRRTPPVDERRRGRPDRGVDVRSPGERGLPDGRSGRRVDELHGAVGRDGLAVDHVVQRGHDVCFRSVDVVVDDGGAVRAEGLRGERAESSTDSATTPIAPMAVARAAMSGR